MKYYNKLTGYAISDKEIIMNHPEDHAEYIRAQLEAGIFENVCKIGTTELTESEAREIRESDKYIVNYGGVFQIEYSQAQRRYYGLKLYSGKGLTSRGRYHTMTAAEVNHLLGFNLVRSEESA